MEPVRWGWIGDAEIARGAVIPGMMKSELCEVMAMASRNPDKAKATAEEFGVSRVYGSYEELLDDPDIEAVYIPLPNHLHVPMATQAARAGKNVLCEKPIALTAAEARTLIDVRDETGKIIQEAFMVLSSPQWLRARELVKSGAIGDVNSVGWYFTYFNDDPDNVRNQADIGGGGLYDIGCYPITTTRFIFDAEPKRVVALVDRDPNFATDRLASVLMDFGDGRQANFICSTQLANHQRATLFGTKGRIEMTVACNAFVDEPNTILIDDGSQLANLSAKTETFPVFDQYSIEAEEFSKAVRGEREPVTSLENSVANMAVLDAIFKSAQSGAWEKVE